jgi:hypothetical protein
MKNVKQKLKEKWTKHEPMILYLGSLAAVGCVSVLVIRNTVSKEVRDRLLAEKKHLEHELALTEDVAWDYHDFSIALLAKYQPSPEELFAMSESWTATKTIA